MSALIFDLPDEGGPITYRDHVLHLISGEEHLRVKLLSVTHTSEIVEGRKVTTVQLEYYAP